MGKIGTLLMESSATHLCSHKSFLLLLGGILRPFLRVKIQLFSHTDKQAPGKHSQCLEI